MASASNSKIEQDLIRESTSAEDLQRIDQAIVNRVRFYASQPPEAIDERIDELRREWSMERCLQMNASALGLLTVLLALSRGRKWALLTCTALGFFFYHGVRGFDPPIPILRKFGIRTRREIDWEIHALKVARGDFEKAAVEWHEPRKIPASEILQAVKA